MATIVERDPKSGQIIGRDLTGHQIGQLEVIEPTDRRCPNGYRIWRARCSCGAIVERPSYRFIRFKDALKSCGCGPTGRPRIPDNGAHLNCIFAHYRQSARSRGLAFELSRDEVTAIVTSDCRYCGVEPMVRPTHSNLSGRFDWNGIDRVDSSLGYMPGNCVACCWPCNMAKGQMTLDQFFAWIKRVANHLGIDQAGKEVM